MFKQKYKMTMLLSKMQGISYLKKIMNEKNLERKKGWFGNLQQIMIDWQPFFVCFKMEIL